jgi:hypothetical protein
VQATTDTPTSCIRVEASSRCSTISQLCVHAYTYTSFLSLPPRDSEFLCILDIVLPLSLPPPLLLGPVGRLRSRSHAIACNVFVRLRLRTICSASVRRLFSLSRPRDVPHPIARSRAGVRTFDIQLLMLEEIRSTAQHF